MLMSDIFLGGKCSSLPEIKRCYLPMVVKSDCPKCGRIAEVDLSDQYLSESQPRTGFICQSNRWDYEDEDEGCGHEWRVHYDVEVILTESRKEEYR
jgi:hypothetical protein